MGVKVIFADINNAIYAKNMWWQTLHTPQTFVADYILKIAL